MQDPIDRSGPEEPTAPTSVPKTAAETTPENPWPLQLLSKNLKSYIDRAPATWVEGQIIELNKRANASYITLRDVDAEISLSLTVWSTVMNRLELPLERGARVVAQVKPDFWVKTGRLSMQTRDIRPVGIGDLLARIERLRQALAAEGLFSEDRKRPLPLLPGRIGLITGRNSDAMKDVLKNAALRWPAVAFEVREVAVQGVNAVSEVTRALAQLDAMPEVDVIVIARGGGSLEDLLPFSHEDLVRAVSAASTPVVSAIGHEADRPLLDDVADLRASTPTDAAKRIVPDVGEELHRIGSARAQLRRIVELTVGREADRLHHIRSRPVMASPATIVDVRAQDISRLRERAMSCMNAEIRRDTDRISHLRAQVRALSPQNTLDRGYAVVQLPDGEVVRDAAAVPDAARLRIRVAVGEVAATADARESPQD
ncbi:exodeoxyribonuclease VII large subunit [Arthrobacter sp. zg-ZUI100]|uniref:Exodeoxyribonuclease 7 large subunit n=1 Tax=Arthrobacter jiangjiafuii TaxID=2817475 RepID=A0A975M3Q7_9MICC|nr:exodeoxyribonuclease VII large subunit [Arthrobacter jiangjiafuii]MBP3034935.1 exodeoxyribonuclease VII large subunit [Arthrobacter jiangjiafuii]MBP3044485.1 exodeoxyribonuclease VII large subunit [Arthrobacter jiangjiafuii]QWC09406.1 exodeoxyribonuclease VII large subunit [Arthrobacter jiangjiafuii]